MRIGVGLSHHGAKDAVNTRRRADLGRQVGVDAVRREVLERPPVRRDNTDGRVARPDDFCGDLHRPSKHPVEGHFCDERRGGRHELLQAVLWWMEAASRSATTFQKIAKRSWASSLNKASRVLHAFFTASSPLSG